MAMKENHKNSTQPYDEDLDSPTEELLKLFSSTLHSLAADAAAIRQVSNLAELTGVSETTTSPLERDRDGSLFMNGNKRYDEKSTNDDDDKQQQKQHYTKELVDLDRMITSMEQKVIALREIINEENKGLTMFETTLKDEAHAQSNWIQEMLDVTKLLRTAETMVLVDENKINNSHDVRKKQDSDEGAEARHRKLSVSQHPARSVSTSTPATNDTMDNHATNKVSSFSSRLRRISFGRRDNDDDDDDDNTSQQSGHSHGSSNNSRLDLHRPSQISFIPVMEAEIQEISRNVPIGPRISRLDLNEALDEIEQVVCKKIALESKNNSKTQPQHHHGQNHHLSTNSLQRRFEYLRQRQRGLDGGILDNSLETDAHAGHWWVSEQELREGCAFFRHGESTARATLSLLCSLKRLKQVPGKNLEITYLCLPPSSET